MNEKELQERIDKLAAALEEQKAMHSFHAWREAYERRMTNLERDLETLRTQERTVLQQYGAFRISLKNIMTGLQWFIKGLESAIIDVNPSMGYTQAEVAKMTADEYKAKILKPLGMGEHWVWK